MIVHTHACVCIYVHMFTCVHALALEPIRMETEGTWLDGLPGTSKTSTCGPSLSLCPSPAGRGEGSGLGLQMATGASLLVGSAVWALWETAGLQGYEGNAQGTASLPSSSVNFLSIFSLPSLTDQLRGSPINCLSLPNSYNTLHLTLSTCHRQPPVTHGY